MSVQNNQRFQSGGSIVHLAKYNAGGVLGAWRDMGTVKVVQPDMTPSVATLKDSRFGRLMPIDERITEYLEKFQIETNNMSLENQVYLWGAAGTVSYSQAATPVTAVVHPFVAVDSIVHLIDGSGNLIYNIASIQAVKDSTGVTTYVAGTDYIVDATKLALGYIYIPPGSAIAGSTIKIDYTPVAITASPRMINPWSAGVQKVRMVMYWNQDQLADITVRDTFDAIVVPAKPKYSDTDYSSMTLDFTVLGLVTSATVPAGRILLPLGPLPTFAQS